METPSTLPIPRLRLSRNPNAYENFASSSCDLLPVNGAKRAEDSDADDRHDDNDDDGQPTPKIVLATSLLEPTETPAARLRALLARTPAPSKSIPLPQHLSDSSDNESDQPAEQLTSEHT